MFPDIKRLSRKQREEWMIMDDQYFSFEAMSRIYSVMNGDKQYNIGGYLLHCSEIQSPCLAVIKLLSGMTREEIREQLRGNNNGHLGDLLTDLAYCDFLRSYKVGRGEPRREGRAADGICN